MNVTNCDETKDSGLTSRQRKCQLEGRAALKRPNVLSKLVHKGLHSSESKAFQSSHIVAIHWHFGEPLVFLSWYSIVQLTQILVCFTRALPSWRAAWTEIALPKVSLLGGR